MKPFLILGHPRSGTSYMATLFQIFGLDVLHEAIGKDGISSWGYVTWHLPPYRFDGHSRLDFQFEHIIQVVRNPIKTVASVAFTEQDSLAWRKQFVNIFTDHPVSQAVESILGWNKLIYAQKPNLVCKLENSAEQLATYLNKPLPQILPPPTNTRSHNHVTLADIKKVCNTNLFMEFKEFMGFYDKL